MGMNRRIWLLCALGGSLAWGQASPGTTAPSKPGGDDDDQKSATETAVTTVAMDAPVLTLKGFCPEQRATSAVEAGTPCQTVITRAQFEKMAGAIRPDMTASVKQQLASLYPRLLVMSQAAEELGLDKQPPYEQMIVFSRMQILTQGLTHKLQEDSANISDQEIAEYYQKNPEVFEEYTLERLFVPLRKQPAMSKATDKRKDQADDAQPKRTPEEESSQQAASERDLKDLAEKLRARAAAGEDFVKLQQLAFESSGIKVASATTSMGKVRRTALPATQASIFELTVGEVSKVITDPGGHYIYKLEAKGHLTMEQAKGEIRDTLKAQRVKQALKKIQDSYTTETNDAYFGLSSSRRRQ
jgi:hypothetical protein